MKYVGKIVLTSMADQQEVDEAIRELKTKGATDIRYNTTEVSADGWGYTHKACILGYHN